MFSSCINKDGTLTENDNSVSQNDRINLLLKQVYMGCDFDQLLGREGTQNFVRE